MKAALCALVLSLACISPVTADVAVPPKQTVYLTGPADFAMLRATNPSHYARAQRIVAAANQLCRPGREELNFAGLDAGKPRCSALLLKTSNPPKRTVSFKLDDTLYIATVVVTDDPARLVHADDQPAAAHR